MLAVDDLVPFPMSISICVAVLRVVLGLTFAAHGYQKVFKGGKLAGTAGWFDSIGMRPGKLHAKAAAFTEIGSGLMMALGLGTSLAAAGMVGVMLVAGYTVHRGKFFIVANGWEYNMILAVAGVCVAGIGPGALSLDHAIGIAHVFDEFVGLLGSLGLGLVGGGATLGFFYRPPTEADAS